SLASFTAQQKGHARPSAAPPPYGRGHAKRPRAGRSPAGASMDATLLQHLSAETAKLVESGLFKKERIITSPQSALIRVEGGGEVLNFCANNYLGLADHPEVIAAAQRALERYG